MTAGRLGLLAIKHAAERSSPGGSRNVIAELHISADEVGALVDDVQATHRSRCAKISKWIQTKEFYFTLPIQEITESCVDALMYKFFGRDGEVASVFEVCSRTRTPIGSCLQQLFNLLRSWKPGSTERWSVLYLSGWQDLSRRCSNKGLVASDAEVSGFASNIAPASPSRFTRCSSMTHAVSYDAPPIPL
jgi:hypothetical protein